MTLASHRFVSLSSTLVLGLALAAPASAQDQLPSRKPPAARKAPPHTKAAPPPAREAEPEPSAEKAQAPEVEAAEPVPAEEVAEPAVEAEAEAAEAEPAAEPETAEEPAADSGKPRVVVVGREVVVEERAPAKDARPEARPPVARRPRLRPTSVPAIAASSPPDELDYTEGAEIPPGYEMGTRSRRGLVIAGAVTLGTSWLLSCAAATVLIQNREADRPHRLTYDRDDDVPPEVALYVPLAGPWIALRTMDGDLGGPGRAALVADGITQATGLALLIAGVAARQKVLVKSDDVTVGVAPGIGNASLVGSF